MYGYIFIVSLHKNQLPEVMSKKKHRDPLSYTKRTYRQGIDPAGLVGFEVKVKETDLHILAPEDMTALALQQVILYRCQLEGYIADHPQFLPALVPQPRDLLAPPLVKEMLKAGELADVGPMAAVAGTFAEFVGRDLLAAGATEIIVENGGDIFLSRFQESIISIFAGASPLSGRIGIRLESGPQGICTSSGTVGHSLSFGKADSVTVLSASTALADAAATRIGNEVKTEADIANALDIAKTIPGLTGAVIVKGSQIGAWGKVELVRI